MFTVKIETIEVIERRLRSSDDNGPYGIKTRETILACDQVDIIEHADSNDTFIKGKMNNGSISFEEAIPRLVEIQYMEGFTVCTRVIIETAHGKTTRIVKPETITYMDNVPR